MPSAWHRIMGGVLLLGSLLVLACGRVGDGPAPRLTSVVVAASAQRGAVDLAFSLADESGAPLSLRVEFRLKNDPTWRLAESAGGLGQGFGLLAGPQAATYHFIWDSAKDAAAYAGPAALRVTVRNPYHRAVAESPAFTLANDNAAPTLTFAQLGPLLDRRLPITLTLRDGESEPLGLGLRYAREAGGETYPLHLTEAATLYESSPSGKNVRLFWDVAADLGMAPETTVWLEAVARDALGAGPALRSAPIPISLGGGPALRVLELSPSLRGLAPITFIVYGDPNRTYTLRAEFRRNVATAYTPLSQEIEGTDATRFLNASAQGQSYVFTWNTLADFPQKGKTRGVGLRFELRDAYEQPFVPPQLVEIAAQGIDNAPLVDTPADFGDLPRRERAGCLHRALRPPRLQPERPPPLRSLARRQQRPGHRRRCDRLRRRAHRRERALRHRRGRWAGGRSSRRRAGHLLQGRAGALAAKKSCRTPSSSISLATTPFSTRWGMAISPAWVTPSKGRAVPPRPSPWAPRWSAISATRRARTTAWTSFSAPRAPRAATCYRRRKPRSARFLRSPDLSGIVPPTWRQRALIHVFFVRNAAEKHILWDTARIFCAR